MNKLLVLAAAGGGLYWLSRLLSAKQMSDKSVVRIYRPRISKTNVYGVTLAMDVGVDNPTDKSVVITMPVITLTSSGKYLASTTPSRQTFRIEPLSQTMVNQIEIQLPWTSLIKYAGGIAMKFTSLAPEQRTMENLTIPLEYAYTTYVNGILYESNPERIV